MWKIYLQNIHNPFILNVQWRLFSIFKYFAFFDDFKLPCNEKIWFLGMQVSRHEYVYKCTCAYIRTLLVHHRTNLCTTLCEQKEETKKRTSLKNKVELLMMRQLLVHSGANVKILQIFLPKNVFFCSKHC
jgi:hypothetical protein